jgi:hypothetical protein
VIKNFIYHHYTDNFRIDFVTERISECSYNKQKHVFLLLFWQIKEWESRIITDGEWLSILSFILILKATINKY